MPIDPPSEHARVVSNPCGLKGPSVCGGTECAIGSSKKPLHGLRGNSALHIWVARSRKASSVLDVMSLARLGATSLTVRTGTVGADGSDGDDDSFPVQAMDRANVPHATSAARRVGLKPIVRGGISVRIAPFLPFSRSGRSKAAATVVRSAGDSLKLDGYGCYRLSQRVVRGLNHAPSLTFSSVFASPVTKL